MIKIQPSGTSAEICFGLKPIRRKTVRGRLGEGSREHDFVTGVAGLRARWRDNGIDADLRAVSDIHISRVSLEFRFRSPRSAKETAVWTESPGVESPRGTWNSIPGSLSTGRSRRGAGALWLSECTDAEGILFRQSPPAEFPITFECRPGGHSLKVTWNIERRMEAGDTLPLPTLRMSRGFREKTAGAWIREWRNHSGREHARDRRVGWFAGPEAASPKDLREILGVLKNARIPLDWYALGPDYASETGDWLNPAEAFADRMGSVTRTMGEQGFIPALRYAPFLVSRKSSAATENRDWLLKNSGGSPLTVPGYPARSDGAYVLDISIPEVRAYIRRTLVTQRDRWGFRAFILERLDDIALAGNRTGEALGGPGAIRDMAGDIIREAVGPRVFLAAAGLSLLSASDAWDARFLAPPADGPEKRGRVSLDRHRLTVASTLLHRAVWSEGGWANAAGPLPADLFGRGQSESACTLIDSVAVSAGMTALCGDPRNLGNGEITGLREFLALFAECRSGSLTLAENPDGGRKTPLIVRNSAGWIGLFNLSDGKKEIRLDRDALKATLGVAAPLSAGDGAVFNSPEIHVALGPRGHRLFRG